MSVKLPRELQVLGKDYRVFEKSREDLGKIAGIPYRIIGCYRDYSQHLFVANDLPADTALETLLHELIHAVSCEAGLGLRENQVRQLAIGLYSSLKRNPETWKLMWKREKDDDLEGRFQIRSNDRGRKLRGTHDVKARVVADRSVLYARKRK
jgi:hypothetical protein